MVQLVSEPVATRKGLFNVKTIGGTRIKHEMKAQFNDEQRVFDEVSAQLTGVEHPFALTDQERFEIGADRMSRPSTPRTLSLPLIEDGPIEQGKEGAILLHNGIMVEQGGYHRLVKEVRSRYHDKELLLLGEWVLDNFTKGVFPRSRGRGRFS